METTVATLSWRFPTSQLSCYATWKSLILFLSVTCYVGSPYFLMWGQLSENIYALQTSASKHMNLLLPRAFVLDPVFLGMVPAMFQCFNLC